MSAATRRSLAAASLALLAVGIQAGGHRATAARSDTLACPGVELAPRLASDRGTPAAQTLDARGRYVPIVLVHGWTSKSTHDRARNGAFSHLIDLSPDPAAKPAAQHSLVGQLQKIPGAAVFTFDYHQYSARWVDDEHLGPALGAALDCLYAKSGEKVIVVGHSMGGLVARRALTSPASDGAKRAEHVSTVVTFATPQTGSLLARIAQGVLDLGSASKNRIVFFVRLVLAYCGTKKTQRFDSGTLCDFLPDFMTAFDTPSGHALQTGSDELQALPDFPRSVTQLDALAGDTTIRLDEGWFGLPAAGPPLKVGDVIVMPDSATHRATSSVVAHCSYVLNAFHTAADELGVSLGQVSASDVAQPLWKVAGPCFHPNLMRTQMLANEATGAIAEDISRRAPNSAPQPPLNPTAVADDVLPVCRDYTDMEGSERDVVLRRMQESRGDTSSRFVLKLSVRAYCALYPGRHVDGVYSPRSRSDPADGGSGSLPTCAQWRELDDAAADAALLRLARRRGDDDPSISTMRLVVGVYCKLKPDRRIDAAYGG